MLQLKGHAFCFALSISASLQERCKLVVTFDDMKSDTYASLRFASDVLLSFALDLFKAACFLAAFARSVSR